MAGPPAQLQFAPEPGTPGPAFVLLPVRGGGDYDVQVNAVDGLGRYGPDARGTLHLEDSGGRGTLMTPDLRLPSGDSVRYAGRWACTATATADGHPEPSGGLRTPR